MSGRNTLILTLCLLAAACSKSSGPSDADLKSALAARVVGGNGFEFVSFEKLACSPQASAQICDVKVQTRNNPMGSSWDRPMKMTVNVARSTGAGTAWTVEEVVSTQQL
jgi:hypothetical protein